MRERTTWNKDEIARTAATTKKADPYAMNQDHLKQQPAADAYLTGDPSSFAEDVAPNNWSVEYSGGQTKRDEIGMPEMRGDTFNHPEKTASEQVLLRRADLACKIARRMLGANAAETAIEDQAHALMSVPDAQLVATYTRLTANDQQEGKESGKDQQAQASKKEQAQQEEKEQMKQAALAAERKDKKAFDAAVTKLVAIKVAEEQEKMQQQAGQSQEQMQQQAQGQQQDMQQQAQQDAQAAAWYEAGQQDQQQQAGQQQGQPQQQQAGQQQEKGLEAQVQEMVQKAMEQHMASLKKANDPQQQGMQQQSQQQDKGQQQQAQQQQDPMQQQGATFQQEGQQQGQPQQQQAQQQQVPAVDAQQQMPPALADDQLLEQMLMPTASTTTVADMDVQLDAPTMDVGEIALGPEDDMLRALFANQGEEQAPAEQEQKQANVRTAATRTVGTRPSAGVSRIGGAGAPPQKGEDVNKLASLWASAPDVRDAFGIK
jgi:hypothetical protein